MLLAVALLAAPMDDVHHTDFLMSGTKSGAGRSCCVEIRILVAAQLLTALVDMDTPLADDAHHA